MVRLDGRQRFFYAGLPVLLVICFPCLGQMPLGPEQSVPAGGVSIDVPGYSVPSLADWNEDGLTDLIVGEGDGYYTPKVRVYLNIGTQGAPLFGESFYVQSGGADLTVTGGGCLGLFPRVVQWDADGNKDLLIGRSDGRIDVFVNQGTNAAPAFNGSDPVVFGASQTSIDVGDRATPSLFDWDGDGDQDLIVGARDGYIRVGNNVAGPGAAPDFGSLSYVFDGGSYLDVPADRSSPTIVDWDGDGKDDILTGNTYGQLFFYRNVGTDSPAFSGYTALEADGVPIDLPSYPRSRPFACDWTGDGMADVLVGAGDGYVRLYQGVPEPATTLLLMLGAASVLRRRRR